MRRSLLAIVAFVLLVFVASSPGTPAFAGARHGRVTPGVPGTAAGAASLDDSDGDGVPNSEDNCPFQPNPGQEDDDGDGVGEACDNCPGLANPGQEDSEPAGEFGKRQTIANTWDENDIHCADLDGDGDVDVVSGHGYGVYWYENTDGRGAFGPGWKITLEEHWNANVFVADIDGDGDPDVVAGDRGNAASVFWHENRDGAGDFGPEQVIAEETWYVTRVFAADIDGDGDMDIVYGTQTYPKVAWFENLDGKGNFGPERLVGEPVDDVRDLFVADLDGDGDMDIAFVHRPSHLSWYENEDGEGNFGEEQVISDTADNPWSVYVADLDGDGDNDVVSASSVDRQFAWHENLDGAGNFGPEQVIDDGITATNVFVSDIDGDGDNDVYAAWRVVAYRLVWYENLDGEGNFGDRRTVANADDSVESIFAADIDGDGDPDAVVGAQYGYFAWYGNGDDGVGDPCDNCPDIYNHDQEDSDADGAGNACDECPYDPEDDADGDGRCGDVDNCPHDYNPHQEDRDRDGIGDACDACPDDPENDVDGDGVCGDVDNCLDDANPDQADTDGDSFGDACDCAPEDDTTYPGAPEINDGKDQQCPGEYGYGVIDETSGDSGFHDYDKSIYSWPAQEGATEYEVKRSDSPRFTGNCLGTITTETSWEDPEEPAVGAAFYYLNRPTAPHMGSWGQDSEGAERTVGCP